MPQINNIYRRKMRIELLIGSIGMLVFILSQIKALALGIPEIGQALAVIVGWYGLLFAWRNFDKARCLDEFGKPGAIIVQWTYSEGEWDEYLAFCGYKSERKRRKIPVSDALIINEGIWFRNALRWWGGATARLLTLELLEEPVARLRFSYTQRGVRTSDWRQYSADIPIPHGKRREAEELVERFLASRYLAPPTQVAPGPRKSREPGRIAKALAGGFRVLPKLLLIVSVVAVAFALYTFRHMVIAPEGLLLSLDGHEEEVDILSWSPDGRLLASAGAMTFSGESNTVRIWDARKGTMLHSFSQDHAHVQGLVFSQDGKTLAVVHAKTVRFIRLPSGSMTGITDADVPGMKEGDFGISQVALSPDGNLCGVAHDGVSLYDVNTGEVLRRHDKAAGERAPTLAFADNGELRFACSTSDSVIVRRMTREGVRQLATGVIPGAAFPFASMRLSSDARVLVYDDDARMVIMDARDGRSIREIANPCGWRSASGVGFSRDNARAIALRGQDSIRIVGLNPPSGPVSRLIPPGSGVSGIALSPDGERCAAISGHDQTCGLYSIGPHAPEPVRELVHRDGFRSPVNRVRRAAFSPDGSMLATANHALKIWSGKK